jgi:uncharacterized protein
MVSVSRLARLAFRLNRLARLACVMLPALAAVSGCGGDGDQSSRADDSAIARQAERVAETGVIHTSVPAYAGRPAADEEPRGDRVLSQLPPVERPSRVTPTPRIVGSAGTTIRQWLETVANDAATFWQTAFNSVGKKFEPAKLAIFDVPIASGCGVRAEVRASPFYCPRDSTMYLPVPFFAEVARPIGDAAEAVIIGHETGHRIQDLLGTLALRNRSIPGIKFELQADCLSGNWAASVFERGQIEPGDILEIHEYRRRTGDLLPSTDPRAHGTGAQRIAAFEKGYNGGRAGACRLEES